MSDQFNAGAFVGDMIGQRVAGIPGGLAGRALGGFLDDAYSKKPAVQNYTTTVLNDLAPENVTLTAHEIYRRITTGHGSGSLLAARDAVTELSASFAARAGQIEAARGASTRAWQGEASAQSLTAAALLSGSLAGAQEQLATNSRALDAQIAAFDHIRTKVEFVPATPPHSGFLNTINPFQTDVDRAINDYNTKAANNVRLYEAYSTETAAARGQVPRSYPPTPPLPDSPAPPVRTATPVAAASTAPPRIGSANDSAAPAATTANATPGGTSPVPTPTGSISDTPGGVPGQGAAATEPTGRPTPAPTSVSAATAGGAPVLSTIPGASAGISTADRRPAETSGAPRALSGAAPGAGGFGTGGGTGTPGVGTGSGSGSGTRGGPSVGAGPVPNQNSAAQPLGRGVGAGPTARGTGGMPMAGPTGRSDGDDDTEHHVKYRVEPDGEELFGTDQFCAPPVIGDRRAPG